MVTRFSQGRAGTKFGPRFHETLTELKRTQWYDTGQYRVLQAEKLRHMVHYAVEHVPYYRDLFSQLKLDPREIRQAEDLRHLPILEKSDIQHAQDSFLALPYRGSSLYERFQTSGTSGKPLEVCVDRDALQMEKAYMWLHRAWGGISMGDRTAAFVGFPVVPARRKRPPFWVHDRTEDRIIFSLQHLSRNHLPAYAEALVKAAPVLIYGYPTAIYLVAAHLNEAGITAVRPRAVYSGSETLLAHQRAAMERAFACPVYDWYGASELVANIVQCPHGNYHVKPEYGIVEALDADGRPVAAGEVGDLVGTGLNNHVMPLLRYRIGDSIVPKAGTCPCGRGGDLVEQITGRVEDVLVLPDGRWMTRLDFIFKGMLKVEEAQLIQDRVDSLLVRIVRQPGFGDDHEKKVLESLRSHLGREIGIAFDYVDSIPRTANGKFRFVISKVALKGRQTGEIVGVAAEEDISS